MTKFTNDWRIEDIKRIIEMVDLKIYQALGLLKLDFTRLININAVFLRLVVILMCDLVYMYFPPKIL
jgi:hypothetical protein